MSLNRIARYFGAAPAPIESRRKFSLRDFNQTFRVTLPLPDGRRVRFEVVMDRAKAWDHPDYHHRDRGPWSVARVGPIVLAIGPAEFVTDGVTA